MWANFGSRIILNGKTYLGLDKMGNAAFWVGELVLNKERLMKRPPHGKKKDYESFLTQRCKTPSEAFLVTTGSYFQTEDLYERQTHVATSRLGFTGRRIPGELVEHLGRFEFIPKPDLEPISDVIGDHDDKEGCLIQYEPPKKVSGVLQDDAYIISIDPIGIGSDSGKSFSSIVVFKTSKYSQWIGEEKIVATYCGRKKINPQEYVQRLALKLSKYYNARVTVENDRDGGIPQYFMRKGESNRLMGPPITTMEKFIPGTKTNLRKFGHSMSTLRHKEIGELLLYEWLDLRGANQTYYDTESGEAVREEGLRNLDRLEDQLLIDQLIRYDRVGNYDVVMAMMGVVVQLKEWYDPEILKGESELADTSKDLYSWWVNRYGDDSDKIDFLRKYN